MQGGSQVDREGDVSEDEALRSVRFPKGVLLKMKTCVLAEPVEERPALRGFATGV